MATDLIRAAVEALQALQTITHIVQVRHNGCASWETIAAFDCESAAIAYAERCQRERGRNGPMYRARKIPTAV